MKYTPIAIKAKKLKTMKHTPIPILSKSAKILVAMGFLAALTATASQAAVIILEASESAMIHEYLNSGYPNATSLEVGPDANDFIFRSLISFDLSSIPDNAVITSASLTLRTRHNRTGTQVTISLHRITESWVNAEGDVSWTKRDASTNWSTPGGSYIATASSALTGTFTIAGADNIFTGLEDDVQLWLDNPSQNFGWMLINSGEESGLYPTYKNFYGGYRPGEPASYPPTLTIEYEVVPEASSAALFLLGAGCLVFFRKRRRANN